MAGADASYQAANYQEQGGARWVIGGELRFVTGGKLTPNSGTQPSLSLITDSTGGTPATTFAAITAPGANDTTSLTADMTAVKNALAQIATQLNAIKATMDAIGLSA